MSGYLNEFLTVNTAPSSVSFLKKGSKDCRIIIYDFKKLSTQKNVSVVMFHGLTRPNLSKEFLKHYSDTDWEISMSALDSNNILCYASQELNKNNWFNMVLFTKDEAKKDVTTKEKHSYAAYTLAAKRFSWVRLYNAILPNGVMDYKNITLVKTKYYDFETMWFAKRLYE